MAETLIHFIKTLGQVSTTNNPSVITSRNRTTNSELCTLHGYLTLNESNSTTSHAEPDHTIARLATRMALLPAEAV